MPDYILQNIKWFPHQEKLIKLNPKRWCLIYEMGCGKTLPALHLAVTNCNSILIICPKGLKTMWERTIKPISGKDIQVITKETFRRDHKTLQPYDAVIVDEAHHFLGMKSGLMKSLRWYLKTHDIEYRYFLTGTPYRSSPFDIFILSMLMGRPLNYYSFFNKFFYNVKMGMRMVPKVKAGIEGDIAEIVQSLGNTVKLADCISMPPQTFKEEYFELTKEQKEAILNLDIPMPVVRYSKIHQICGGTLKGDEYEEDQLIKSEKFNRLIELSYEIDRVIVVCRYNIEISALYNRLREEFPDRAIEYINGEVENRQEILDRLTKTNSYILLVNAKVSEGWQLQNCNHMIFYSYDFELKNKLQMEARLTRIDAPRPTFYLSMIVKDTIDEAVLKSLKNKESFHVEIYNGIM